MWNQSSPLFHSRLCLWPDFWPYSNLPTFSTSSPKYVQDEEKVHCNHFFLVARCVVKLLLCISEHHTCCIWPQIPSGLLPVAPDIFVSSNQRIQKKIHWPFSCKISQSVEKILSTMEQSILSCWFPLLFVPNSLMLGLIKYDRRKIWRFSHCSIISSSSAVLVKSAVTLLVGNWILFMKWFLIHIDIYKYQ